MNQDMTFCGNKKCKYKKCDMHYSKINWIVGSPYRSFAMYNGTKVCPLKKRGAE